MCRPALRAVTRALRGPGAEFERREGSLDTPSLSGMSSGQDAEFILSMRTGYSDEQVSFDYEPSSSQPAGGI